MIGRRISSCWILALASTQSALANPPAEGVPSELIDLSESSSKPAIQDIEAQSSPSATIAPQAVVVYEAPADCPDRATFIELVLSHDPNLKLDVEQAKRWAIVRVQRTKVSFSGSFILKGDGSETRAREVASPSCQEVVSALSVVTAIALDPTQQTALLAEPVAPDVSDSPASASTSAPTKTKSPKPKQSHTPAEDSPVAGSLHIFPPKDEDLLNEDQSMARHPKWNRGARLQHSTRTSDGELSLRRTFAFDAQTGATFGLYPHTPVARFDFTGRMGLFMKAPKEKAFLVGFMPRLRVSMMPPARYLVGSMYNRLDQSFFVALGACYSPYFNPKGFALLACADYGGGTMTQDSSIHPDEEATPPASGTETLVNIKALSKISATLDAEYNFWSVFHLAARVGFESYIGARLDAYDAPDSLVSRRGAFLGLASAGLGLHF